MLYYVLLIYAVLSLFALVLYYRDKRKAKKGRRRTPESVLLGIAFFGGSVGALCGMSLFRHKTRHWYFWAVCFLGLAWQVALAWYLLTSGF